MLRHGYLLRFVFAQLLPLFQTITSTIMIINNELLDKIAAEAHASPRLRMNFNLHDNLHDNAQRLINVLLPCTIIPIHRHRHIAETYLLLRG